MTDLLTACQLAYRKHHLNDESIGWDELSDILFDALCNELGHNQEWRISNKEPPPTISEIRKIENNLIEAQCILDAIKAILDGNTVSDFFLSFPVVGRVWELVNGGER